MPVVSVIVPIYNVEPYLRRCLDSILVQTFTDFELILIDDGSMDNCGAICDEYASADSRVKVIHQVNGGVGKARNVGLEAAVGKYIYFCDGDDYIEKDLLNDAVKAMDGYDMVVFNIDAVDDNGHFVRCAPDCHIESEKWNEMEYKSRFLALDYFRGFFGGYYVICRLFKKDIINRHGVTFPENAVIAEDTCFNICYLLHADSIHTISGVYYHYARHHGSTMDVQKKKFNFDNNNEVGKTILHHIHNCSTQVMLNGYYPIMYFSLMNHVILRAKSNQPTIGLQDIRFILFDELKDTTFFLEQAEAFVHSKQLFLPKWYRGRINAMIILTEWSYYVDGNKLRLIVIVILRWLEQAIKKLKHFLSRLKRVTMRVVRKNNM